MFNVTWKRNEFDNLERGKQIPPHNQWECQGCLCDESKIHNTQPGLLNKINDERRCPAVGGHRGQRICVLPATEQTLFCCVTNDI